MSEICCPIASQSKLTPDQPALINDTQSLTYLQLDYAVRDIQQQLINSGIVAQFTFDFNYSGKLSDNIIYLNITNSKY